jgi:tetratricopeptide (TPR) repeat protein
VFLLPNVQTLGVFAHSPKAIMRLGVRFGSEAGRLESEVKQVPSNTTNANASLAKTVAPAAWGAWLVDDVFEYATPGTDKIANANKEVEGHPLKKDDVYHAQAVQEVIGGNRQAGLVHFQSELESDLKALTGHPETQFQTLLRAAQELQALGENQTAHQCLDRAKKLAHEAGLSLEIQRGLALQSARNAKDAGSWTQAEGFYKGLLTHATPGSLKGIERGQVLGELGEVVWHLAKPEEAEQHFKAAIDSINTLPDASNWSVQEALGEAVSRLYTLYLNTQRDSEAEALKVQYAHCPVPIIPAGF